MYLDLKSLFSQNAQFEIDRQTLIGKLVLFISEPLRVFFHRSNTRKMRFTIVVALVLLGVCAVYSVPLEKSKLKKSLLNKISGSPSTKQARSHLLKKFFDDSEEDVSISQRCAPFQNFFAFLFKLQMESHPVQSAFPNTQCKVNCFRTITFEKFLFSV